MVKRADEASADGKTESVAQMVRDALDKKGWTAKPDVYREYIMNTFGKDVPKNQISQYKSAEKRKKGMNKKRGKPAATSSAESNHDNLDVILEFIGDLHNWEKRLGGAKIKEIVMVLYKKA